MKISIAVYYSIPSRSSLSTKVWKSEVASAQELFRVISESIRAVRIYESGFGRDSRVTFSVIRWFAGNGVLLGEFEVDLESPDWSLAKSQAGIMFEKAPHSHDRLPALRGGLPREATE